MSRLSGPLALALLATACHWHRDTNAPGHIEVAAPPPPGTYRVEPRDPGEHMLALNPGLLFGGGARAKRPRSFGELGLEVSVNRGENERSHQEDGLFIYPQRGFGGSLGWSFLHLSDDLAGGTRLDGGPLYAEAHVFRLPFIAGGGYAVNPFTGDHGPQLFGALAMMYLRARYMFDAGAEITLGAQFKLPFVRVWSR
jgi:hypothetical protein